MKMIMTQGDLRHKKKPGKNLPLRKFLEIIFSQNTIIMKTMFRMLFVMILSVTMISFTQAQTHEKHAKDKHQKEMTKWDDAKEAYHSVMAGTFHPAEEGNYAPLKEKAHELHKAAKEWESLSIPDGLSKDELKKNLKMLVSGSASVDKLVKKGAPDTELKDAIYSLHDVFHAIVGLCDH